MKEFLGTNPALAVNIRAQTDGCQSKAMRFGSPESGVG
jgi:hypothetical protein